LHNFQQLIRIIPLLIGLTFADSPAQDELRLKFARALEKSGNYAEALKTYQELYRAGVRSAEVINGSIKAYKELRRIPELEEFLARIIALYPREIYYKIAYGTALYLNNKEKQAFQAWDEVCAARPSNIMNFRFTASEMIELRLYPQAIAVYKKAMIAFEKQELLYRDIAALYRALLDYENAVESLLLYNSSVPGQLSYARSQIIAMSKDEEAVKRIISAIDKFMQTHPAGPDVEEIIASLYLKNKEFEKSYAIYQRLHSRHKPQNFLLQFAREAYAQGAFTYAINAYNVMLGEKPDENLAQNFRLQLAESYYASGRQLSASSQTNEGQLQVKNAEDILWQISAVRSNASFVWQALERLGDIRLEYYNDIDQALQRYDAALKLKAPFDVLDRVYLKSGNAFILKNNLTAAEKYYLEVRTREQKKIADFNCAEIFLFKGRFAKAKAQYEQLLASVSSRDTVTNNALSRLTLIEQYAPDSLHFARFCSARLLQRQKKESEAARELEQLFSGQRAISPLAGEISAEIYIQLNKTEAAELILKKLLSDFSTYRNLDKVCFLLAGVYETKQQPELALDYYRKILTEFPASFYFDEARERARNLVQSKPAQKLP
jgi:tetratricopeptide (TPR) repeat protein